MILPTTAARTGGLCRPCKNKASLRLSGPRKKRFDAYWSRLNGVGWLADLPNDSAREDLRQSLRETFAEETAASPACLSTVFLPDECIEDQGDYVKVVEELARGSYGLFAPSAIVDCFDHDLHTVVVSFELATGHQILRLPLEHDYPHPDLFRQVNRLLAAAGEQRQFFELVDSEAPGLHLCFLTPAIWQRAIEDQIVPAP